MDHTPDSAILSPEYANSASRLVGVEVVRQRLDGFISAAADHQAFPGFTLAECDEIGGNFIDPCVYWKGKADVSALAGRPIWLYFKLLRAKLYACQFLQE